MPFVNVPVLVARQILTAAIMNQYGAALNGFSSQTADMAWPLVLGGDIDADNQYTITNMPSFWNIINANEYDNLSDAIAAVNGSSDETCLLIPPGVTINGDTGVTITRSNVLVLGCGMSSIVNLKTGAGPLFDTDASLSNITFMHLQITDTAAASGTGVRFKRTTGARLIDVLFTGVDGDSVYFTNDGTAGNACIDAMMQGVRFAGGGANGNHIKADDLDGLQMDMILSKSAGGDAIVMEPDDTNSLIRDIQGGASIRVESPIGKGISILGESATADAKCSRVNLCGPVVVAPGGIGIELGATAKLLQDSTLSGKVHTPGGTAFSVDIQRGRISNLWSRGSGSDTGLDINESDELDVDGGTLRNFDIGIDASDLEDIASPPYPSSIRNVDVRESTTEGVKKPVGVDAQLDCGNNLGDTAKILGGLVFKENYFSNTQTNSRETVWTYVIPGGTMAKHGDGFIISGGAACSGSGTKSLYFNVDGSDYAVVSTGGTGLVSQDLRAHLNGEDIDGGGNDNTSAWALGGESSGGTIYGGQAQHTVDWTNDVTVLIQILAVDGVTRIASKAYTITFFEGKEG